MSSRWSIVCVALTLAWVACKDDPPRPPAPPPPPLASDAAVAVERASPPVVSELAHLRGWDGEPTETAVDSARGCDEGDPAACYRLGNLYEEGIGTEHDMARAHTLHARACDAGRGEACRILGLLLRYDSGVPADVPRADRYLARACELNFLDACHLLGARLLRDDEPDVANATRWLARGCQRGYGPACRALESSRSQIDAKRIAFPSLETLPIDDLPVPSPEAACPPLHHMTTSTGGGAQLNGGLTQVAPEVLLAAIPKKLPGWKTERERSSPAGRAGTRVSEAHVEFAASGEHLTVTVMDNFRNCTLQPHTGEMALAAPATPGYEKHVVDVGGRPAVAYTTADHALLSLWLADRCSVYVQAQPPRPTGELVAFAATVDLDALEKHCAKREAGF